MTLPRDITSRDSQMVEVSLSVEGGGVYIVGQTIKCTVSLHNTSDVTDRLAWATGQISGHVTLV